MYRLWVKVLVLIFFSIGVQAGDIANSVTNTDAGDKQECPSGPENLSPEGPSDPSADPQRGNPIHVGSGNKFQREVVYRGRGEFPLEYSLYYNSRFYEANQLKGRWTASYSRYVGVDLQELDSGDVTRIYLHRDDGQTIVFTDTRNGFLNGSNNSGGGANSGTLKYKVETIQWGDRHDPITETFRSFSYVSPRGLVEQYNGQGLLTKIITPQGNTQTVTRTNGTITDSFSPYLGPALCREGSWNTGLKNAIRVYRSGNTSGADTYAVFFGGSAGASEVTEPHFVCTDPSGPQYINWECKLADVGASSYRCNAFAHVDAQCTAYSSYLSVCRAGEPCHNDRPCIEWEDKKDGEKAFEYGFDVKVTDDYGNQISWREEGIRPLSGGSCIGCASELTTSAGTFAFGRRNGMITSITHNETNSRKRFLYEIDSSDFQGGCNIVWDCATALTGIIDEEDRRYATWSYLNATQNKSGGAYTARAYKSYHGVGAEIEDYIEIDYTDGHARTVTNAYGFEQSLHFTAPEGSIRLTHVSNNAQGATNCKDASAVYRYISSTDSRIYEIDYSGQVANTGERVLNYTYYPDGRIESITEAKNTADERKSTYVWHPNLRRRIENVTISAQGSDVQRVEYKYWPNGRLHQRIVTDLSTFTAPYPTNGRQKITEWSYEYWDVLKKKVKTITIDGPRTDVDDITLISYDESGNLIEILDAKGHSYTFRDFDPNGLPQTIVDPNNMTVQVEYNYRGQLTKLTLGSSVYNVQYYKHGLLKSVEYPEGEKFTYEYTSARKLKAIFDQLGNQVNIERSIDSSDASLQKIITTISNSSGVKFKEKVQLDALGRVYKWMGGDNLDGSNPQYLDEFNYDGLGRLTAYDNGKEYVTSVVPDNLGRPETVVNSDTGVVTLGYNAFDQITSVEDPRQLKTTYIIDGFGRVIQRDSPDTGITVYHYDEAGNLTSELDSAGKTVDYVYDALNRLTDIDYPGTQNHSIDLRYDATANNNYGKGRLTSAKVASGISEYTFKYNSKARLETKTQKLGGRTHSWGLVYDRSGNVTTLTYPSGRAVTYGRDGLGRISSVTSTYLEVGEAIANAFEYGPFGPVKAFQYGNGINYRVEHNNSYWPAAIEYSPIEKEEFNYYPSGLLENRLTSYGVTASQSFIYDTGARLEGVTAANWDTAYMYDANGNRTQKTLNNTGTSSAQALVSAIDPQSNRILDYAGSPQFVYDDIGRLKQRPILQPNSLYVNEVFEYGDNGRLQRFTSAEGTAQYQYGPFGERAVKKSAAGDVYYLYQGPQLMAEMDAQGNVLREYIYADDMLIAMFEPTDSDGDGMDDDWEIAAFGDLSHGADTDFDGDGLSDSQEYMAKLAPLTASADDDLDGMPDDWERYYFGTLGRDGSGDFDGDGVTDLQEFARGTDPTKNDLAWLIPVLHNILH